MTSAYDRLHDEYWSSATPKAGTRYERLVAFVLKALDGQREVIHDIKLLGSSQVKHQIDVTFKNGPTHRRVLVECKDFDVSANKVGLGIVRDFSAVVEDTRPDEAIVITCVGFTEDAQKFAKHKGIKLAVLREFRNEDGKGRIQQIVLGLHIHSISDPRPTLQITEVALAKFQQDMTAEGLDASGISKDQPVYLNLPDGRLQINEFIQQKANAHPREVPGPVVLKIPLSGTAIEVGSRGGAPIEGIELEFEVIHENEDIEIVSKKVARLLLEGFGDKDLIVFEDDLIGLSIDEGTGEIKA